MFEYALEIVDRPKPNAVIHINRSKVNRNTPWRQVSSGVHIGHQHAEVNTKWNNKLERDFKISNHHLTCLIGQREYLIIGYTIVSDNKPSSVALLMKLILYLDIYLAI